MWKLWKVHQRQDRNGQAVQQFSASEVGDWNVFDTTSLKDASSMKLHRNLGITQKVA